jgi:hypothetical protein
VKNGGRYCTMGRTFNMFLNYWAKLRTRAVSYWTGRRGRVELHLKQCCALCNVYKINTLPRLVFWGPPPTEDRGSCRSIQPFYGPPPFQVSFVNHCCSGSRSTSSSLTAHSMLRKGRSLDQVKKSWLFNHRF